MSLRSIGIGRRAVLVGAAGIGLLATGRARAQSPDVPKAPVALTVIDAIGALAVLQPAFEAYPKARPDFASRISFLKSAPAELAPKVKAQQETDRNEFDLVLTGPEGLHAGIEQNLWTRLLPDHAGKLPAIEDIYLPPALNLQRAIAGEHGLVAAYSPGGPLLSYAPERVKEVPESAEDLLAFAKANPRRFVYARPSASAPARAFLLGLPYLLGDRDPKDPADGWERTWAYLAEMNGAIDYYPAATTSVMKEYGEGQRDIVPVTAGWDINPRALGIVPKDARIATLKGFRWISEAFYMAVPRGLAPDDLLAALALMAFVLRPEQQAFAYDEGFFYPGPAVKDVTLAMAPKEAQDLIAEFGRPEYAALMADVPIELPLAPDRLALALKRWDEQIGGKKVK